MQYEMNLLLICVDDQSLQIGKVIRKIDRIYYFEHSVFQQASCGVSQVSYNSFEITR